MRLIKLRIGQLLAVVVLLLFIFMLMREATPVDIPLSEVEDALNEQGSLDNMLESDDMRFKRSYGLNAEDYEEILYYEPITNMDVEELLIVHVSDSSQISDVKGAMEDRIEVQRTNFDGYGVDQLEVIDNAVVYSNDMYVCLIISNDSASMLNLIKSMVEE